MEEMANTFQPAPVIIIDKPTLYGIHDHLAHDGVIVNVQPVIP